MDEKTLPKDIPNLGSTDFKSEPYYMLNIGRACQVYFKYRTILVMPKFNKTLDRTLRLATSSDMQ